MTTYKLTPAPNTDRVWLLDHPEHGGPLKFWHAVGVDYWTCAKLDGERFTWAELLELGDVTDVDPDDMSWLPPGPLLADGEYVRSADDAAVLEIYAPIGVDGRARLAALITKLLNEHVGQRNATHTRAALPLLPPWVSS